MIERLGLAFTHTEWLSSGFECTHVWIIILHLKERNHCLVLAVVNWLCLVLCLFSELSLPSYNSTTLADLQWILISLNGSKQLTDFMTQTSTFEPPLNHYPETLISRQIIRRDSNAAWCLHLSCWNHGCIPKMILHCDFKLSSGGIIMDYDWRYLLLGFVEAG